MYLSAAPIWVTHGSFTHPQPLCFSSLHTEGSFHLCSSYPIILVAHSSIFQAYQAFFRISHPLTVNLQKPYPGINDDLENRAMCMLEITFQEFFSDTKQLVEQGVLNDIKQCVSQAHSDDDKSAAYQRGKEREKSLKHWLKLTNPLAYGHRDQNKTYESLLQAVVADAEDIPLGLPHMMQHGMAPSDFVKSLISMSHPNTPTRPHAPVLSNGSFLPTLKIAHERIIFLVRSNNNGRRDPKSFVTGMFSHIVRHLDISFVPSHLPQSGSRGAPNTKPVYNSWAYLSLRDQSTPLPLPRASNAPSSSQRAASFALHNALAHDSNAAWSILPLHLANIASIVHKAGLPIDYATPSPSNVSYVNETFEWVKKVYDSRKPLHHLALLISLIVTCLCPQLFLPVNPSPRPLFVNADTKDKVRDVYNSLPWEERPKKGCRDETILVPMFTTFIIALYEPTSPLRIHMQASSKGGLGDAWTAKYCNYPCFS
jgi:hypothetical protein